MRLSLNFVKDYVDIDENIDVKELAEKMTAVGNEYDEATSLVNATNLVVGEVLTCQMHPDSDHLHLCEVNIGEEVLNIVCGAPNVRNGLKVIVAKVGAELPGGVKIKKGLIRGQESNGMLCSLYEIGIDKKYLSEQDKNGICELPSNAKPGDDPIKVLGLDDKIIDFELTANRGDLLSILGMAYEISSIYNKEVRVPDLKHNEIEEDVNNEFNLNIETENCSLFLAKKVKDIVIKESPDFIKNRLIACGIRPINNVVDISNYVMLELGQPLHFYDSDNLGDTILVRMAKNGEELVTLDSTKRILNENDIVITNGKEVVGLAGVMGGINTEVENTTKNVLIEAAIFDSVKVRKTSNKILRSEASNRFEKGLDPNRTYMAIERACRLLEKYANAKVEKGLAEKLSKIFLEIIIAPDFSEEALEILTRKKNIRLMKLDTSLSVSSALKYTNVNDGLLVQEMDQHIINEEDLKCVTNRKPTEEEIKQLLFGWKVVKHVKSNAIVLVKNDMTVGVGAGQMNRVGAAKIAIEQAGEKAKGSVLASDAFFPMPDTVQEAIKAGVTAIIQPGGSIKDQLSIDECNEHGIAMVFTGVRHFKH